MSKITILTFIDRIALFYSLKPFLFFGGNKRFDFTSSTEYCLKHDKNKILIMVRQFLKPDYVDLDLLKNLRKKYDIIAFFHDDAGGGIPRLEVLPYVDLFYQKAVFKNRTLYKKHLYGKELYSHYYHEKYGIIDPDPKNRVVIKDDYLLKKIRLSWNIGVGDYPREQYRQRLGTAMGILFGPNIVKYLYSQKELSEKSIYKYKKNYDVHARLSLTGRPSIAFQRLLIMDIIKNDPRFLIGKVSQKQYNYELLHSKMVLSPFGWGELCIRDFEAVRAGAVLLKPDMSHLETWPDIFIPNETYVPFSWDGDNLIEQVNKYLSNEQLLKNVAMKAFNTYTEQLSQLENRFESIIEEITHAI